MPTKTQYDHEPLFHTHLSLPQHICLPFKPPKQDIFKRPSSLQDLLTMMKVDRIFRVSKVRMLGAISWRQGHYFTIGVKLVSIEREIKG